MFCVAALVIFSILGLFSATHREYAKQALDCVFRRVTLRPCNTGFREQTKSKILAKLLSHSVPLAKFFNKNFELLAWIFMIAMIGSTLWAAQGLYKFYLYGSCNGLNQSGFCAFDPTGENNKVSAVNATCGATNPTEKDLTLSGVDLSSFPKKNAGAKDKLVMVACYECDYSRATYPEIAKLVDRYNMDFTFIHFPVKEGEASTLMSAVGHCAYAQDQNKFWELNKLFFSADKTKLFNTDYIKSLAAQVGLNPETLMTCANDPVTIKIVTDEYKEAKKTKFYGTPTVWINGEALVGPKPYRVYRAMVRKYILF